LVVTVFEWQKAGNSEQQQKQATAYLFSMASTGTADAGVLQGLGVNQTTTESSSVLVNAGGCVVQETASAGASVMVNDTQITLDVLIGNPMGGLPRNDIVVMDRATTSIRAIIGTPNAVPTDPTVPTSAVPLARLRNPASATTVKQANIDDLRNYTYVGSTYGTWFLLPLASGVSGTLKYRRRGGTTDIAIDVTGTFAGAGFTVISAAGAVPSQARPTITPARAVAYVGSGSTLGTVEVDTAGTIRVQNAAAFSLAKTTFCFPAG
jgi:hypothetical protein